MWHVVYLRTVRRVRAQDGEEVICGAVSCGGGCVQVKYLQEGARVHKTELEWQSMKMQHRAQQELDALKARHAELEHALQASMDDLTCAAALHSTLPLAA